MSKNSSLHLLSARRFSWTTTIHLPINNVNTDTIYSFYSNYAPWPIMFYMVKFPFLSDLESNPVSYVACNLFFFPSRLFKFWTVFQLSFGCSWLPFPKSKRVVLKNTFMLNLFDFSYNYIMFCLLYWNAIVLYFLVTASGLGDYGWIYSPPQKLHKKEPRW